ncbi:MAG: hypothetical protein JRH16_01600 [Deltaproteobacteria bacterium]|nr:hypothetical protein [Deltaproteobacteria bacterium]
MGPRKHRTGPRTAAARGSAATALNRPYRDAALLFAALLCIGGIVYAPALAGPFVSDDNIYLPLNPWVQEINLENVGAMFDPTSSNNLVTANYAPTQMLLHMAQWAVFGRNTVGYHLTNLILHALVGVLFAALLLRSGAPLPAAGAGAALLLFHPASAEAVSWISQLKTLLAMSLALGALLLRNRSRAGAAALFLLGLFAKPIAAVGLAFLVAEEWVRRRDDATTPVDRASLLIWGLLFATFASIALVAYRAANIGIPPVSDEPWIMALSCATFGARYLAMAATTYGVSAFQEPPIPNGVGDPWVWLALALGLALVARVVVAVRERLPELPYWIWAAAAFVPVAQILPFRYPMADRYLYFILPGLIGGVWFAAAEQWQRVPTARRRAAACCAGAATVVVLAIFAVQSYGRASIWASNAGPTLDAVARWPDGAQAHRERGRALIYNNMWAEAIPELRVAAERRVLTLPHILQDPILAPRMGDPRLQPLIRDVARLEIELLTREPQTTEYGWIRLAQAQLVHRDFTEAEASLASARKFDGMYGSLIEQLETLARGRQALGPSAPLR